VRVLIAEDDVVSRRVLESFLAKWGYEVLSAGGGIEAWEILQRDDSPHLALLDWMMPGINGVELCRRIREADKPSPAHIILVTARGEKDDIVKGLQAGADDYVTKPFNHAELQARLKNGTRLIQLQLSLARRVRELEEALENVKLLTGLLPICSYCKKIRDDKNYWQKVENYISQHSDAVFSHGICPDCFERIVKPDLTRQASK
jgi:sigma-B regulation protein RsbU (phosphoserine phosphatase)